MNRGLWIALAALASGVLATAPGAWAEEHEHPGHHGGGREHPGHHGMPDEDEGPEGGEEGHGARFLKMLDKKLDLSAEQRGKIEAIVKESEPKMEDFRKRMKALHEEMEKAMRSQFEKIRTQLNEEQRDKFDEMKVMMRRRMGGRPGMGKGPMGPGGEGGKHGMPWWREKKGEGPEDDRPMGPPEMWHEKRPSPDRDR